MIITQQALKNTEETLQRETKVELEERKMYFKKEENEVVAVEMAVKKTEQNEKDVYEDHVKNSKLKLKEELKQESARYEFELAECQRSKMELEEASYKKDSLVESLAKAEKNIERQIREECQKKLPSWADITEMEKDNIELSCKTKKRIARV